MLLASGVPVRVVQEIMRHSDIELTTRNYIDATQLPTIQAINSMPNLTGKVTPKADPNFSTLAGISCPKESEKREGENLEIPFNKGVQGVMGALPQRRGQMAEREGLMHLRCSPLLERGCRLRLSNPPLGFFFIHPRHKNNRHGAVILAEREGFEASL